MASWMGEVYDTDEHIGNNEHPFKSHKNVRSKYARTTSGPVPHRGACILVSPCPMTVGECKRRQGPQNYNAIQAYEFPLWFLRGHMMNRFKNRFHIDSISALRDWAHQGIVSGMRGIAQHEFDAAHRYFHCMVMPPLDENSHLDVDQFAPLTIYTEDDKQSVVLNHLTSGLCAFVYWNGLHAGQMAHLKYIGASHHTTTRRKFDINDPIQEAIGIYASGTHAMWTTNLGAILPFSTLIMAAPSGRIYAHDDTNAMLPEMRALDLFTMCNYLYILLSDEMWSQAEAQYAHSDLGTVIMRKLIWDFEQAVHFFGHADDTDFNMDDCALLLYQDLLSKYYIGTNMAFLTIDHDMARIHAEPHF